MSYIILGDVHLGKGLGIGKPAQPGFLNSRLQDSIDILYWTLEQAGYHKSSHIIITGDVFDDARPHPAIIAIFMRFARDCHEHNVNLHIIPGNHDILRTGAYTTSALDIIPALNLQYATVYKDITQINIDGQNFTFCPYKDRRMFEADTAQEALKKLLESLPDPKDNDICVGHLAIEGGIHIGDEIDDMLNEIFVPPEAFKYAYTFMGHIHRFQKLGPTVYHTGSMERSDFGDAEMNEDKFIILIKDSKPEFIKIPNRNIRKIQITVPADKDTTDFVNNELCLIDKKTSLKDSIMRIEITLSPDVDNCNRQKIYAYVYEKLKGHYICSFSESRNINELNVDKESIIDIGINADTAIRQFFANAKDIDDSDKEEALALALAINEQIKESESGKNIV